MESSHRDRQRDTDARRVQTHYKVLLHVGGQFHPRAARLGDLALSALVSTYPMFSLRDLSASLTDPDEVTLLCTLVHTARILRAREDDATATDEDVAAWMDSL